MMPLLHVQNQHQAAAPFLFDVVVGRVMRDMAMHQPFSRLSGRDGAVVGECCRKCFAFARRSSLIEALSGGRKFMLPHLIPQ
jgi:hypothetical protein